MSTLTRYKGSLNSWPGGDRSERIDWWPPDVHERPYGHEFIDEDPVELVSRLRTKYNSCDASVSPIGSLFGQLTHQKVLEKPRLRIGLGLPDRFLARDPSILLEVDLVSHAG